MMNAWQLAGVVAWESDEEALGRRIGEAWRGTPGHVDSCEHALEHVGRFQGLTYSGTSRELADAVGRARVATRTISESCGRAFH